MMKKKGEKEQKSKSKVDYVDLINRNLHDFKAVFDYSGYQYTRLDLSVLTYFMKGKFIDVLSPTFKEFKYLQNIVLSNNNIVDLTHLATLPNLVSLIADHNNVKDFKAFNVEEGWKSLRVLNLSYNKIGELTTLANVPNLRQLYVTQNKIEKVQGFGGHPRLKIVELRRNKIGSLQGLGSMEELGELYLAQNKIKSLVGLEIPKIKILHLRKNNIVLFEETFPLFENLEYLNLRQNSIERLEEVLKTKDLPNLKDLIFSSTFFCYQENPLIAKSEFYLFQTINSNLRLKRINKVVITKSIKQQAFKHAEAEWKKEKDLQQQRLREQEEKAKAEEQAAIQAS